MSTFTGTSVPAVRMRFDVAQVMRHYNEICRFVKARLKLLLAQKEYQ